MRWRLVLSGLLALLATGSVFVVEACSSDTLVLDGKERTNSGNDDESGSDAATNDTPTTRPDSGPSPTTDSGTVSDAGGAGTIQCGNVVCDTPVEVCCSSSSFDGGGACATAAAGCKTGTKAECDQPSDCGSGRTCCVSTSGWACAASCPFGAYTACQVDSDCGSGGSCKDYSCPQPKKVRTCTQPFLCQ